MESRYQDTRYLKPLENGKKILIFSNPKTAEKSKFSHKVTVIRLQKGAQNGHNRDPACQASPLVSPRGPPDLVSDGLTDPRRTSTWVWAGYGNPAPGPIPMQKEELCGGIPACLRPLFGDFLSPLAWFVDLWLIISYKIC